MLGNFILFYVLVANVVKCSLPKIQLIIFLLKSLFFCYCLDSQCGSKHISRFLWPNRSSSPTNIHGFQYTLVPWCLRKDVRKFPYINQDCCLSRGVRYAHWRLLCLPTTLEEKLSSLQSKNYAKGDEYGSEASSEDVLEQPISNDQVYKHSCILHYINKNRLKISLKSWHGYWRFSRGCFISFHLQYGAFS